GLVLCICCLFIVFFFFSSRRRHTRSKRDWSSDVCSSDLDLGRGGGDGVARSRGAFVPAASSVPIVSRPRATSWGALGTARASVAAATSDAAPATVPHARVTPATGAATPTRSLALPGAGSHAAGGRAGVARGGVARH